ncbi:Uncharacterised protein [Psychrobacter phenylpyruvicus]|uniref:Uncharacterized protein n=1 Tax=Psychrobacter phenylpyruvicus TaxID=29432 RepID=A0A379LQE3_9GAMM|nr:Uncharacterised protein [Psychrobacter phenylpyruvicus]
MYCDTCFWIADSDITIKAVPSLILIKQYESLMFDLLTLGDR